MNKEVLLGLLNKSTFYKAIILVLIGNNRITSYRICELRGGGNKHDFKKACKELVKLDILKEFEISRGEEYSLNYDVILDLFLHVKRKEARKQPNKKEREVFILYLKSRWTFELAKKFLGTSKTLKKESTKTMAVLR